MDETETHRAGNGLPAAGELRLGLRSRSLFGLAAVQFFTVLNDNTFRWLVVPIGYVLIGPQHKGFVLALGLACFVIPYVLLVAPAAYLADRYSKQRVIAGTMLLQAGVVVLGTGAILLSNAALVFTTLVLMGAQGALLAPAKAGTVPEVFRPEAISEVNGILGMASVSAAVVGSLLGNGLYLLTEPKGTTHLWISGATIVGISLLGWVASLFVARVREADPQRELPTHLFAQTRIDLESLISDSRLLSAAVASSYFWFLAALAQVTVYLMGSTMPGIQQKEIGYLIAILAAGTAVGSLVAGIWSARKVDTGLVPIGAAGIVLTAVMMFVVTGRGGSGVLAWSLFYLFFMGVSSGIYAIPLASYLQYNSPARTRGEVLAAANFLDFFAMFVAAVVFWVMRSMLDEPASRIFLVAGVTTILVFFAALYAVPAAALRALLRPVRWLWSRLQR